MEASIVEHERLATGPAADALRLYRWMYTMRCVDAMERELVARGEAFFHVSGAGHEASAALALHLRPGDYLHGHYRDKALMLAMGLPLREFFDSLLCNAASHSGGRQMSAHLSAPALNILSTVGPVGNQALQAVGVAQERVAQGRRPVVVCSMGDGTTQQGEVLEAIAEAVRSCLPVLFLVHDNRYAISTRTLGQTFFSQPAGDAASFYGLPLHRLDGSRPGDCVAALGPLVDAVRAGFGPAICVLGVERLSDHTNADDESVYRSPAERTHVRAWADPLAHARAALARFGVAASELERLHEVWEREVRRAAEAALDEPEGEPAVEPPTRPIQAVGRPPPSCADGGLTMAQALRATLRGRLAADPRVSLYGQDIEDPKGDVFGVTRGLSVEFPGRVRNAPLSESTIVGTSIGRALAGGRPVAFLQFADFIPLAFNQIATELASMAWRTRGGWTAPVILLVSCGAYRPGLGPFHAHTFDSVLAQLPGIDVLVPSTAADAAAMLDAAFDSARPSVMLYPKALLHARNVCAAPLEPAHQAAAGAARIVRQGHDLTLVAWGNTVSLCEQAAESLAGAGLSAEVIDLRRLAPWDRAAVVRSVSRTRRLLVVHEDKLTGGFGAEVVAAVVESLDGPLQCRRVARADNFVPCHFGQQLEALPSFKRVLEAAAQMLSLDVLWEPRPDAHAGLRVVPALGSSPADQTVEVVSLPVGVGQAVSAGQVVASVEADKAVFDIAAPADGVVHQVHLAVGARVAVGTALLTLSVRAGPRRQPTAAVEQRHRLVRRAGPAPSRAAVAAAGIGVAITAIAGVRGSHRLHNDDLALLLPGLGNEGAQGILRRTGIESRCVAGPEQDAVGKALAAARLALDEAGLRPEQLSLILCSTTTPTLIAPSTACQVLHRLAPGANIPACDVQAACSGYLYALAQAWDFLQQQPDACVLVLTTETLRRVVDLQDPQTSPIFGDAASATVVSNRGAPGRVLARLHRPLLGARGDDGAALRVPLPGAFVHMDGKRVFGEAVHTMCDALAAVCKQHALALDELDLVVPHQANGRILDAVSRRLGLPAHRVWNEIRHQGNTSSSSIPLALDTVLRTPGRRRIGLCAFGAGYTHGAAVLECVA